MQPTDGKAVPQMAIFGRMENWNGGMTALKIPL
jgi:hypothetical protein